ncbi:Speckle-type POZ protein-like [Pseudolycoriella hygida]|uniref:Speckle-type POZ protein-like n=1 Tax=Pseudolycoriella hygida TaxID=35572 RepID=A0A9Q0MIN5_9DIPT|nr:Speckle-type POZ protein-like [Pseudolycoriella hygida]
MKLKPIERRSELNMMIENWAGLKPDKSISSNPVEFLDCDAMWWISIKTQNPHRITFICFLLTSESVSMSEMWNFYIYGTINGIEFESRTVHIVEKESSYYQGITVGDRNLDLKLVMCMYTSQDRLDEVPLLKFIDTASQYKHIIANNKSILENSTYSDFSFFVSGRMFKVHKSILAAASPVFDELFERKYNSDVVGHCRIEDVDATIFQYLLDYIYYGKIPDEIHNGQVARNVFKVARYYEINELQDICVFVLKYTLTKYNAVDVFELAEYYGLEDMKTMAWTIIQFDILELSDAEQPETIDIIRSLIAIKEEKKRLLQELQEKIISLNASAKNLLIQ